MKIKKKSWAHTYFTNVLGYDQLCIIDFLSARSFCCGEKTSTCDDIHYNTCCTTTFWYSYYRVLLLGERMKMIVAGLLFL
jgi:hypothetical protein